MSKNKYANYGKVSVSGDAISYGIERYYDILRDAEERYQKLNALSDNTARQNVSPLKMLWRTLTQIF